MLDLFCCQGGAGEGYRRAGFRILGVDHKPQPRYPGEFWQADLSDPAVLAGVILAARPQAIHASPPCQKFTQGLAGKVTDHLDLLTPTRPVLAATGLPYVIENVPRAPMIDPLQLCGSEFRLTATDKYGREVHLKRHRLFESNVWLWGAGGCYCLSNAGRIAGVYGAGNTDLARAKGRNGGFTLDAEGSRAILGVPWMTLYGAQQCVPPAYTEFIGRQLIERAL